MGRTMPGQRVQAGDGQLLEDVGVQLSFGDPEQVPVRLAGDPQLPARGLARGEQPAQLPDVGVHQAACAGRASFAPYLAYEPRRCDCVISVQQQNR